MSYAQRLYKKTHSTIQDPTALMAHTFQKCVYHAKQLEDALHHSNYEKAALHTDTMITIFTSVMACLRSQDHTDASLIAQSTQSLCRAGLERLVRANQFETKESFQKLQDLCQNLASLWDFTPPNASEN